MVSNCTKSPCFFTSGRRGYFLCFFHGLRFFRHPYRDRTRFTVESETTTPSTFSCSHTTSEHRLILCLVAMIRPSISLEILRGEECGLELNVSSTPFWVNTLGAFLHHFTMVDCPYPKYLATSRVDLPPRTIRTACARSLGIFSFVVYAILIP